MRRTALASLALAACVLAALAPRAASAQDTATPPGTAPPETSPLPETAGADAPEQGEGGAGAAQAIVAPTPTGPSRRLIVIDVATYGIDPVVGRVATERIRRTGLEMGYEVLDPTATVAAAQRLRMPYPPTPADLWRVTWVAQSHRGAFARIWAAEGRYVIELSVASLDGGGPFFARETAGSADLRDVLDRLVRATLPPPSQWQEQAAQQMVPQARRPTQPVWRERPRDELAHPGGIGVRLPEPPLRRFQLTLQTEAVFGTTPSFFYNHMVGARFDVRITRELLVGGYVAYVNAEGRADRVHNMLFLLQGEYRIRVSPTFDLTIPLRVGLGYMPFNGPVVRIAAGLNYPLSEDFEIGVDLISPTFWILPQEVAFSLDLAAEVTYRFP